MTKLAEYIPFVLYVVMIVSFFAYVIRRKLNPAKNLFVTGDPVKLAKRIELDVFLSREDFIEINLQVTGKSRKLWIGIYTLIFIAVMTSVLLNLLANSSSWILLLASVAIFIALAVVLPNYYQKRNFGKLYDSSEVVKNSITYVLDSEKGELLSAVANANFTWDMVTEAIETQDYVLIYIGEGAALFLAKDKFAQDDQAILLDFLNANFRVRKR